jgi:predicted nucleic acid-binding protein
MMDGLTFVDTNVLVYAHDRSDERKYAVARTLIDDLWTTRSGTLSTQVLQEFYVVATRKLDRPMRRPAAAEIVALYGTWRVVSVEVPVILAAIDLEASHRLSFWDALIVAAARLSGASRIVTEDLQHSRHLAGVRIENPFR